MKKTQKMLALVLALALVLTALFALAGCQHDCAKKGHKFENRVCTVCGAKDTFTSHDYLTLSPSNWNEMDYQDNNDTAILGYIGSSFFGYDYALIDESKGRVTADGKLNVENLDLTKHIVTYEAATALEDVTADYAEAWGLTEDHVEEGGYVWKITLREDLKWDDGTAIKAEDFVYSMKEQLNQDLMPLRADTYWEGNGMKIHNAKNYYYQGKLAWLPSTSVYPKYDASLHESLIFEWFNEDAPAGSWFTNYLSPYGYGANDALSAYGATPEDLGTTYEAINALNGLTLAEILADEEKSPAFMALNGYFGAIMEFFISSQEYPEMTFDEVGIFAAEGSEYEIIVVLDEPQAWIREDGSLSYTISNCSLPLVKEDLYESCKKEPIEGAENWTTTYNTTVETTASWGPYKLTFFQNGKQFRLDRNEYWYGYGLDEYKDQYLTDAIVVDIIPEPEAQKMAFWKGEVDSIAFDSMGADATTYENSDYALFFPASSGAAYGIQLYSNLPVLNENGKNNSILAIKDFRWAMSLAFDRAKFISDQLLGLQVGLGLLGPGYYYDPEESLSYRDSVQAKEALLRTYGFTKTAEGKWTDGSKTYADVDDATDAMTGYNLTLAKEKLALAIAELEGNKEKYNYDPNKDIIFRLGQFNAKAPRRAQLLQECIDNLVEGSSLEGKIKIEIVDATSNSADMFRDGEFELYVVAAISGAVFYPFSTMDNYLGFGSMSYHDYVNYNAKVKMTMPEGDYAGAGEEVELTLQDWSNSLNGRTSEAPCSYNWGEGFCPTEVRLEILAMLEEYALSQYHSIQVANDYTASLTTAKFHYISDTYHTFMGLGGARYIRYDYSDSEWAAFVAEHNGDLSDFYKSSNN
ncbi:MAG: hypothetical protein IJX23_03790 [Clostridia bacterium]|nr:hypothetical protein [Clostridia bacterium]